MTKYQLHHLDLYARHFKVDGDTSQNFGKEKLQREKKQTVEVAAPPKNDK